MSVRRGILSEDPDSVTRREWYSSLQEKVFDREALEEIKAKTAVENPYEVQRKIQSLSLGYVYKDKSIITDQPIQLQPFRQKWVVNLSNSSSSSELMSRTTASPSPNTILCFPGIGYNHSYFKKFVRPELASVLFYGVCLPGRQNRLKEQQKDISVSVIAEEIYRELLARGIVQKCNNNNNLILFGHCFGCILLFEVARLLEANFVVVDQVLVAGSPSPSSLSQTNEQLQMQRDKEDKEVLKRRAKQTKTPSPQRLSKEALLQQQQQEQREERMRKAKEDRERSNNNNELLQQLHSLGGLPPLLSLNNRVDLLRLCLPVVLMDRWLRDSYRLITPDFEFEASEDIDKFSTVMRQPRSTKISSPVLAISVSLSVSDGSESGEPVVTAKDLKQWIEVSTSPSELLLLEGGGRDFLSDPRHRDKLMQLLTQLCRDI